MPRKSRSTPPRPRGARRNVPAAALAPPAKPTPCFTVHTTAVPSLPPCYFTGAGPSECVAVYTYDAQDRLRRIVDAPGRLDCFLPRPAQGPAPKKAQPKRPRSPRKKKGR